MFTFRDTYYYVYLGQPVLNEPKASRPNTSILHWSASAPHRRWLPGQHLYKLSSIVTVPKAYQRTVLRARLKSSFRSERKAKSDRQEGSHLASLTDKILTICDRRRSGTTVYTRSQASAGWAASVADDLENAAVRCAIELRFLERSTDTNRTRHSYILYHLKGIFSQTLLTRGIRRSTAHLDIHIQHCTCS